MGMKIKAAAFDYGKVICNPPRESVWAEIASLACVTWDRIDPVYRRYRLDYDRGKFSAAGFYKKILDELGMVVDDEKIAQMGELDLGSWKDINAETVELMQDLMKAGKLVGVLSNMPFDFLQIARRSLPVFSLPNVGIYSCEAGSVKPEKEIYLKLLDELKCRAEEVVFFDDLPDNIEGALKLGIQARLWEDCRKARRDLAELGVVF
ncbi:MAG: HAD family phosphatase [Treponema sp.]|nr:HAD family phosphatase [Treponema sp.]